MTERTINVGQSVMSDAIADADALRMRLARRGTLVVNLLASPGAGKTTLLEATARRLGDGQMAVLVGDIATDRDARRLAPLAPTVQLTTGGACHLELPLVKRGLAELGEPRVDFLFIENVGNLVCPSSHDLGEHLRVVMLSTTEGDDKPAKYPKAFRTSHALVISKLDLLDRVPFSISAVRDDAQAIQPRLSVFPLCAPAGDGMDGWCRYLEEERLKLLANHHDTQCTS